MAGKTPQPAGLPKTVGRPTIFAFAAGSLPKLKRKHGEIRRK
jgi:hypothetical protein